MTNEFYDTEYTLAYIQLIMYAGIHTGIHTAHCVCRNTHWHTYSSLCMQEYTLAYIQLIMYAGIYTGTHTAHYVCRNTHWHTYSSLCMQEYGPRLWNTSVLTWSIQPVWHKVELHCKWCIQTAVCVLVRGQWPVSICHNVPRVWMYKGNIYIDQRINTTT